MRRDASVYCMSISHCERYVKVHKNDIGFDEDHKFILISTFDLEKDIANMGLSKENCLELHFIDNITEPSEHNLSIEESVNIIKFLLNGNESKIIIACDGGISRSAAIALFVEHIMLGRDIGSTSLFLDPSKNPNERVFITLYIAWVTHFNAENIDQELDKIFIGFDENLNTKVDFALHKK